MRTHSRHIMYIISGKDLQLIVWEYLTIKIDLDMDWYG